MKRTLLFLWLAGIGLDARAAPWVEPHTRISFPDECGGWTRIDTKEYPEKWLGVSVHYQNPQGKLLTVYIYTNGLSGIPSGGENVMVAENIREVAGTVTTFWTRDGVTVEEILPVSDIRTELGGRVQALMTAHRIRLEDEVRISISAVTGYRGRLLKIRYTYAKNALDEGISDLGRFVTGLMAENQATMDGYFVKPTYVAPAGDPTREDVLKAIRTLEDNLLSADAAVAAGSVVAFAEKSGDVTIMLGDETVPWVMEDHADDETGQAANAILLGVYLGGNVKSQLEREVVEDDPLAGWRAVIRAYRQLKGARSFSSEAIDELVRLEEKGELSRRADEVKARAGEAASDAAGKRGEMER